MAEQADSIADCVLEAFAALPAHRKPRVLANGNREWVPLAGVVVEYAGEQRQIEPEAWAGLIERAG